MKSGLGMDCIVIVLALARRLGGFYSGGKWHAFLDESPVELLAKTIGTRTARMIVITDFDLFTVPASHPRAELIRIAHQPRTDIAAALLPLARHELKAARLLLVDAAAPGLESQTMARLVQEVAKTDLARLRYDAAAVAITRDGLRRALRAPARPRAKNLWEWTTRVGETTEAGLRVTDLNEAAWHERTCEEIADVLAALSELRLREALRLVQSGLRLRHPASFDLRGRLRFGSNVAIDSHVTLRGTITLGDDVVIEPHCILENARIASGVTIKAYSTITDSTIGPRCRVGPFARIRPGCTLGPACQIGNYVEVKDTRMQGGCKINHHTFIGDAELGRDVIIGAGSVTCNFDGARTQRTIIRAGAFVGSGVMLIAPLTVGRRAFIAAGSTVTKGAPAGSLTITRAKQISLAGWKPRKP